jgi:mannose-6-phosphate isomerase-like protein (cupin superfamily)
MEQRAAPYVLAAGQARSHPGAFPAIKAGAADTAGLFTFVDGVMAARTPGPPLHVHQAEDECLYVVDGHLLVQLGEEQHDLGPGCFAWLPRRVPHAFANGSDRPVHILSVITPGGIEEMFAEQAAYLAELKGPPDLERLNAIWAPHGHRVGPQIDVTAAAGINAPRQAEYVPYGEMEH